MIISRYRANVLVMSLAFFLGYTAFSGIQNLETSVVKVPNAGAYSLATLYIVFTISCLGGPWIALKLGTKWSLLLAFLAFDLFYIANLLASLYPENVSLVWGSLLPTSALVGMVASFLWTAQGSYMATNAAHEKRLLGASESSLGTFNGIFWLCFQATQLSGNLTSSFVLSGDDTTVKSKLVMLFIVYLACGVAGTVVMAFLRNVEPADEGGSAATSEKLLSGVEEDSGGITATRLSNGETIAIGKDDEADEKKRKSRGGRNPITMTYTMWSNRRLQLLMPIMMYSGIEMGFIWGDFTANYVKPALGQGNIGYVMAIFGCVDAVASFIFGKVSDRIGRTPIMIIGTLSQLSVQIFYMVYIPPTEDNATTWAILVLSASLWGVGDAAWNTQINSILGEEFADEKEGAFANLKLFQSLMTSAAFFYTAAIHSVTDKLWILICFNTVGIACFLVSRRYVVPLHRRLSN